jgi:quercetin dioxygenase-like cupin family protein
MTDFPNFMKHPANRIATTSQATPAVEGYIFDGADGNQMAFWTCHQTATSVPHSHDFDEYMLVVEGCYTLLIDGKRIPVHAGEEYVIPRGILHGGEVVAGTRTIHAFGGHRADRVAESSNRWNENMAATRSPRWYLVPLRLAVVTFIGTLLSFAVSLKVE